MELDLPTLLPYIVFGAITLAIWAVMSALGGSNDRASERLDYLKNPANRGRESDAKGMGALFEKAAPALSRALQPKTDLEASALKVRLANAGFLNPAAPQIYLAAKLSLMVVGLVIGGGIGAWKYGLTQSGLTVLVGAGGAGFYLPAIVLWYLKSKRQQAIFLSLPDALDLLVVCVEAGLGLDAGMRRVTEEMNDTAPEMCEELDMCLLQLQMGRSRREVLHDLGVRTGVDDVKALVAILIQADKFGSSVAQALRVQSDAMRIKRRQIAEEKAQKTAVQMLFPLVIFIFPGVFVVLVGPAAIKFMRDMM
jgi:tight adherence protein C